MFRKFIGLLLFFILVFLGWDIYLRYQLVGMSLSLENRNTVSVILYLGLFLIISGLLFAVIGSRVAKIFKLLDAKKWARISFFSGEISLWVVLLAGKARDDPNKMKGFQRIGKFIYYIQLFFFIVVLVVGLFFYLSIDTSV